MFVGYSLEGERDRELVKCRIRSRKAGTIKNLEKKKNLQLVTDSQDVRAIKENFGNRKAVREFDGFFVDVSSGDYGDVYGFHGIVPNLDKAIYKIGMTCK